MVYSFVLIQKSHEKQRCFILTFPKRMPSAFQFLWILIFIPKDMLQSTAWTETSTDWKFSRIKCHAISSNAWTFYKKECYSFQINVNTPPSEIFKQLKQIKYFFVSILCKNKVEQCQDSIPTASLSSTDDTKATDMWKCIFKSKVI